jgi:hypothetical protein
MKREERKRTVDFIAEWFARQVTQAALVNLGVDRQEPEAHLLLDFDRDVATVVLAVLRFDLVIPGGETPTRIAFEPKMDERSRLAEVRSFNPPSWRVTLIPHKTDDDVRREEQARAEAERRGRPFEHAADYPNRSAFLTLVDHVMSLSREGRHWCSEIARIEVYHPATPHLRASLENAGYAPFLPVALRSLSIDADDRELAALLESAELAFSDPGSAPDDIIVELDLPDLVPIESGETIVDLFGLLSLDEFASSERHDSPAP